MYVAVIVLGSDDALASTFISLSDLNEATEPGLSKDFVKTQHSSAIKLTLTIPPSFVTAVVVGVTTGQVVSPSHLPC